MQPQDKQSSKSINTGNSLADFTISYSPEAPPKVSSVEAHMSTAGDVLCLH